MNIIVGCDFHSRFQLLVVHDMTSQSRREVRLEHDDPGQVASFYRQLPPGSLLLIESTAFTHWFLDLIADMPLRVKMGCAGRLAAMRPKKVKTDRRDAAHLVDMYLQGAFPEIAMPTAAQRELRHLLLHRDRLVRMRTRLKNGLHWLAMNHGLNRKSGLFTTKGRRELAQLRLDRWERVGREDMVLLHDQLEVRIAELDQEVRRAAEADAAAARLMLYPGVGAVTALAWVLIMGDCSRFPTSAHAASYIGLVPSEDSSGSRRRLGAITKQGNRFLRWVLVQAAQTAVRGDAELGRYYKRLAARKKTATAKVAVARKLSERLYWMCRRGVGYPEVVR
ncbi:MAG TPA: IS110 family transposase [Terriglobales bacterium]|nr:IS110 family transposase [Terriglobales bacterium]